MRAAGQPFWLPRGDFVLLLSLAIVLIGVFVLPVLGAGTALARYSPRLVTPSRSRHHYDLLLGQGAGKHPGPNASAHSQKAVGSRI
jgi:hypothetical protein